VTYSNSFACSTWLGKAVRRRLSVETDDSMTLNRLWPRVLTMATARIRSLKAS